MKIIIARSALSDLQEIKAYYLEQGVADIGQRFVNAILNKLKGCVITLTQVERSPSLIKIASGK